MSDRVVDELESLSAAVHHVIENKQRMAAEAQTYTEVTYKSRGEFQVGLYVDGAKLGECMRVGMRTAFLSSLSELQRLSDDALFKIEVIRTGVRLLE